MRFFRRLSVVGTHAHATPVSSFNSRCRSTGRAALHAAFTPTLFAAAVRQTNAALVQSRGPASASVRMLAGAPSSEQAQSAEKLSDAPKTEIKSDQPQQQLQLNTGGFIIPHPQKVAKGGEDAFYIATNQRSFGVADGVGGWADAGVDPGNFARNLMREARKAAEASCQTAEGPLDSFQILCTALANSRHIIGSSTACILCLNGDTLLASNIGDSGFVLLRDGKLLAATPPQQHRFNFPYQIGTKGNPVTAAQASALLVAFNSVKTATNQQRNDVQNFVCKLKPGDIIVSGTDGLFDNVFSHRTTKLVWDAKKHGALPGVAAQQLATFASARSMDPVYLSPFAKAAAQAGFFYRGGKVDDITVVVSYVTAAKSNGSEAAGGDAKGSTPLDVNRLIIESASGGSSTSSMSTTTTEKVEAVQSEEPKANPADAPKQSVSGAVPAAVKQGLGSGTTAGLGADQERSGGAGAITGGSRGSSVRGSVATSAEPLANARFKISKMSQQSKL